MQSACAVLYCRLWLVWLYHIFPHYLINGTILGKKVAEYKTCFDFIYNFCWNISHSNKNWAGYYHKCTQVFMWSARYSCQIFIKTWILSTGFLENTRISNFMNTRPVETELFHADRRTDMKKLIVAFRNFANAPVCVCMYVYLCMYVCMYVYVCMYAWMRARVCMCVFTPISTIKPLDRFSLNLMWAVRYWRTPQRRALQFYTIIDNNMEEWRTCETRATLAPI
jgi:hypothetical protein